MYLLEAAAVAWKTCRIVVQVPPQPNMTLTEDDDGWRNPPEVTGWNLRSQHAGQTSLTPQAANNQPLLPLQQLSTANSWRRMTAFPMDGHMHRDATTTTTKKKKKVRHLGSMRDILAAIGRVTRMGWNDTAVKHTHTTHTHTLWVYKWPVTRDALKLSGKLRVWVNLAVNTLQGFNIFFVHCTRVITRNLFILLQVGKNSFSQVKIYVKKYLNNSKVEKISTS